MHLRPLPFTLPLVVAAMTAAPFAQAFCGFYVAGSDQKLYNNATMVVLMREGTRTVLSMQNNYQGPPENFAMVVPVPVVLQKENVKTLPKEVFDTVDKLASPRLVEYWEQDPCSPNDMYNVPGAVRMASVADTEEEKGAGPAHGVKIEAQFKVEEYDIVILSARDSTGLDTWLRQEKYKIPDGSEPVLRPYVQGGSKFFVAKVDSKKVRFQNGMAQLSPLRFHYDSELFALPVRLGLVNSSGTQDLIVHVLARGQRYETANYPNVAIPTNLDVKDEVRNRFGEFYAALFDRTVARHPRAVITEYSWDASTCDPCPGPPLTDDDFQTLGADVIDTLQVAGSEEESERPNRMPGGPGRGWSNSGSWVVTRLHMRYGKEGLGEDLIFRTAPPIVGGREFLNKDNALETGAVKSEVNNFQARYAIRHPWTGPIACEKPQRGIWGGPPGSHGNPTAEAARDLAFAKRGGLQLAAVVARDDEETKIDSGPLVPAPPMFAAAPGSPGFGVSPRSGGCAGCRVGDEETRPMTIWAGLAVTTSLVLGRLARRRKQNRP